MFEPPLKGATCHELASAKLQVREPAVGREDPGVNGAAAATEGVGDVGSGEIVPVRITRHGEPSCDRLGDGLHMIGACEVAAGGAVRAC